MSIDIKGKGSCSMAQISLNRLDIVSTFDCSNSIAMPLRYNKDKLEKPLFARVSGFVLILFLLKASLFSGTREAGCMKSFHIKDKNLNDMQSALPTLPDSGTGHH